MPGEPSSGEIAQALAARSTESRRRLIDMITDAGMGHIGSDLSAVDILTVLYFHVLRIRPAEPEWPDRDRFVLSKGHAVGSLYVTLAAAGYFPFTMLSTFMGSDSPLPGHPDRHRTPGVDASTGSLGHGLSVAVGMALATKLDNKESRTFVLLGDGELQEGSVWEAAMAASHFGLDNLVAIVDRNGLQLGDATERTIALEPLAAKWESFGWATLQVDGHDFNQLVRAFGQVPLARGKPTAIIAKTIKGKGVSFMENQCKWHHAVPSSEERKWAICELESM